MFLFDLGAFQEVLLLDNEISFNEAIIDERDQGIQEIQDQIGESFGDISYLDYKMESWPGNRDGLANVLSRLPTKAFLATCQSSTDPEIKFISDTETVDVKAAGKICGCT
ncbi:hypothetical protein POM88_001018 [Heracleum sosnowskyi]|uniref:Uncharacterized protein n=1 Tax=Heracleum sosnowskyi TaxID=360622 RepID=A0AAD8JE41_9APIA|nr:hypothetical protein POM88_001018 [Heracleum sosnowskyi]